MEREPPVRGSQLPDAAPFGHCHGGDQRPQANLAAPASGRQLGGLGARKVRGVRGARRRVFRVLSLFRRCPADGDGVRVADIHTFCGVVTVSKVAPAAAV